MAETVLVTGATGFVGSAVARHLVGRGYRVRALVRPGADRRNLVGVTAELVTGDLADPPSLLPALRGCQGLMHVAADYRLWAPDPAPMYRVNVEGTRALMTAALEAGVRRIVYTSSVAVLGHEPRDGMASETTTAELREMVGDYKRSKFLAEQVVRELVMGRELPAVIVNPSTPVGPRDIKPTPTGRMILEAARRRVPAVVDTGLNLVHVDDVAAGHCLAYERGVVGERYILGGDNLPLAEIFAVIAGLTGLRPPRWALPAALLYPLAWGAESVCRVRGRGVPLVTRAEVAMARRPMYFTSARAERELGYRHRPAAEALADALAWARSAGQLSRAEHAALARGPHSARGES
jgi:dihydroflavonol-4-reductase